MLRMRYLPLAVLFAWGGLCSAASSDVFVLDLRTVKTGFCRTESCAVAFSGTFELDLRTIDGASVSGVVQGASNAFALDLRELIASGEESVVAAFGPAFVLDLRTIQEEDDPPGPTPGTGGSAVSSFPFVLDLRDVDDPAASAFAQSGGFALDLRMIKDERAGGETASSAIVWISSGAFELDLCDIDPVTMCEDVVFLYSNDFELDLRKITVEGVILLPEDITGGKAIAISEDWVNRDLDAWFGEGTGLKFYEMYGYDIKSALLKQTGKHDAHGNALLVWHDYVAGTDPTDVESVFSVQFEMRDGKPVITWRPALNGEGVQYGVRIYRVYGARELGGEWTELSPEQTDLYQFFKVTVGIP